MLGAPCRRGTVGGGAGGGLSGSPVPRVRARAASAVPPSHPQLRCLQPGARARPLSRCARPPYCAQSCPARCRYRCQRPAPAPVASAARRRDRAARRRVPCGQARLHREAPSVSTLACAQVLGRRISAASPDGARRGVSDMLRAEVPRPSSRARSLRPLGSLHASHALAPPHAHQRLVRRAQADCASWVAGRSRPWPAPPRGATVGVSEARKGAGKAP